MADNLGISCPTAPRGLCSSKNKRFMHPLIPPQSNGANASFFLFSDGSKRPNLIQYPKFHWELWQSLLLGGRRFIGRPLSMAPVAAAENRNALVKRPTRARTIRPPISAHKPKAANIAFWRRYDGWAQDHEAKDDSARAAARGEPLG